MEEDGNEYDEYEESMIPTQMKGLRACLRCGLIKEYKQFRERGCENCESVLQMTDDAKVYQVRLHMYGIAQWKVELFNDLLLRVSKQISQYTTIYFEGMIAITEPGSSWVAKWNGIGMSHNVL